MSADSVSLTSLGDTLPADMTICNAFSTDISVRVISSSATISRKPDVGLGEVGMKTVSSFLPGILRFLVFHSMITVIVTP